MDDDGDIDLAIEDDRWHEAAPALEPLIRGAINRTRMAAESAGAVALVLSDDAQVAALNAAHRGKAGPTNVLSFPAGPYAAEPGAPAPLGDIILAFETVAREAAEQGKSFADHMLHLIVHGTLHLVGFDHISDAEAEEMEQLERDILTTLNIADPYHADRPERQTQ